MGYIILIIIGIALFYIWTMKSTDTYFNERMKNTIYIDSGIYVTGYNNILSGSKVSYELLKDKISLVITDKDNKIFTKTIGIKEIEEVKIISDKVIEEKINLGKLVMFGAFSLLMKDKHTEYENFIELVLKDGNSIILKLNNITDALNKTIETMGAK